MAEDLPPKLLLGALLRPSESTAENADLILKPAHYADGELLLLAAEPVSCANHFGTAKGLCLPLIALQARLQVSVALSLQQVVVLALLFQEMALLVATVVANQFDHLPNRFFVLADQLPVLPILVLLVFDTALLNGELSLEIGDASS